MSTHSADKQPDEIDFAHIIHEVRFGSKLNHPDIIGKFNALQDRSKLDGNCKYRNNSILHYDTSCLSGTQISRILDKLDTHFFLLLHFIPNVLVSIYCPLIQ